MTSLLLLFLLVLLFPLFISTWRTSLTGLSAQGLLMGWMAYHAQPTISAASVTALVDLVVVRGVVVPLLLYRVMRVGQAPRRNDVIPPNMFSWGLVGILVALAFRFASRMAPADPQLQTHLAVAAAGVLLGLFVLATQVGPFSQVVGALRLENAVALFELSGDRPIASLPVRGGQLVVFLLTAWLYASYLKRLRPTTELEQTEGAPR
jgi:hydrogenase-4 membrane subunit HyfE